MRLTRHHPIRERHVASEITLVVIFSLVLILLAARVLGFTW